MGGARIDTRAVARAFLHELQPAGRGVEPPIDELGAALHRLISAAHRAWPSLNIPDDEFARFVAQRVASVDHPVVAIGTLRAADLFLACACSRGDSVAAAAFLDAYDDEIGAVARRFTPAGMTLDDLKQVAYEKILVGDAPKIAQYGGRGELRNWARVSVLRLAQNLVRGRSVAETHLDSALLQKGSPVEDQELRYLRQRYRPAFRAAFRAALDSLSSQERNILRYRYQDGRSVDAIASVCCVHRMTMTRWIADVRKKLLDRTQLALAKSLCATQTEVSSIMRLVRSRFDITLGSILSEAPASSCDSDPPPSHR